MKKYSGEFRPWATGDQAVFIPRELNVTGARFELLWSGEKTKVKDEQEYKSLTGKVKVYDKSKELGIFWVDGTVLGKSVKGGVNLPESGILDIKDGTIVNVKGE